MVKKIVLIVALALAFNSEAQLISIAVTKRAEDDGSKSLTRLDSSMIRPFSVNDYGKAVANQKKEDIYFELIDAGKVREICAKNKYTWVFVQSSWCGACVSYLTKYSRMVDSLQADSVQLIVISQDILIRQLQKKIYMEKFKYLTYILDPEVYGTDERKKQEKFITEINGNTTLANYSSDGVPKTFFLDNKGNLIYFDRTYKLNTSFILDNVIKKR